MPPLLRHDRSAARATMRFALSVMLGGAACSAAAADFSLGLAAGAVSGKVDCVDSFSCDRSSGSWKLTGTYLLNDTVDIQAAWFDAGKFKGGDTTPQGTDFGGTFKVSGFGLTAGYRRDIAPGWSVSARGGVAVVRTKFDYQNDVWGSVSKTRLEPLAGVGIGYAVTPALTVGLDYDVTGFKVHTQQGVLQMLGLAARYSF